MRVQKKVVSLHRLKRQYGDCSSVGRASDCGSECRGFEPRLSPKRPTHKWVGLFICFWQHYRNYTTKKPSQLGRFFRCMLVCLLEPTYVAEVLTVRKICRFGEETQSEFVGTTCGRDEVAFESNFRTFFANQSEFVCFV